MSKNMMQGEKRKTESKTSNMQREKGMHAYATL